MPTVERAQAVVRRISGLDAEPGRMDAIALGLVDAVLERDGDTLAAALDALRDARTRADGSPELVGRLDTAIAVAHWGLERVPSAAPVAHGTQAHDFLRALDGATHVGSTELRELLEVDETQVSRTGRRLLESGLVTRRKVGRQVFWQLTPRGRSALAEAPAERRSANSEFWQEALRRGFEAAAGDEPGERRQVDPTRERIIECTLDLHLTNGIQATTWSDIAAKADVPTETVQQLFPTFNDLVTSCGEHVFERLGLPPRDRARDMFAGAAPGNERIHRLVSTFFGVYERGADGITAARRERYDLAPLSESMDELDNTLDTLVAEALRPASADGSAVASVRALTDLEVWRSLRHQGATPESAVDEATGAVERWLEGQPRVGNSAAGGGSLKRAK
jgi:AcrR family transcriptional regulator/DNA-binding transcriptional ArsR family regulator